MYNLHLERLLHALADVADDPEEEEGESQLTQHPHSLEGTVRLRMPNAARLYHHQCVIPDATQSEFFVVCGAMYSGKETSRVMRCRFLPDGTPSWRRCRSSAPQIRSHSCTVIDSGNRMIVIGGYDGAVALDSVYEVPLRPRPFRTWNRLTTRPATPGDSSCCPGVRYGHRAVRLPRDRIFLFGGDLDCSDDNAYVLDVHQREWERLEPREGVDGFVCKPCGRFGHVMVRTDPTHILLFFGAIPNGHVPTDLWEFDLETLVWTELPIIAPPEDEMKERQGCGFCMHNGLIFVTGGISPKFQLFKSFLILNPKTLLWRSVHVPRSTIYPVFSSQMFFLRDSLFVQGGAASNLRLSQMLSIQLVRCDSPSVVRFRSGPDLQMASNLFDSPSRRSKSTVHFAYGQVKARKLVDCFVECVV